MSIPTIIRVSPRFGVLLLAMLISIAFLIADICSVTGVFKSVVPDGLNPFWKLAFVFKCLTDSIILDDFKTALDRLMSYKLRKEQAESVYLRQDSDGCHSTGRDRDVTLIEDIDEYGVFDDPKGMSRMVQPGPLRFGSAQKAMPTNVSHYDEISLPDLEHFAANHTWKGHG